MAEIPEQNNWKEVLEQWYAAKEELSKAKAKEALLRPAIFKHFFPDPSEGVNTRTDIPELNGWQLKGDYVINRSVDEPALLALSDEFAKSQIRVDMLIKRRPELVIGEYRDLTAEQLKLFDQCLVIKPGMPQLEVKPPSTRKAKK